MPGVDQGLRDRLGIYTIYIFVNKIFSMPGGRRRLLQSQQCNCQCGQC